MSGVTQKGVEDPRPGRKAVSGVQGGFDCRRGGGRGGRGGRGGEKPVVGKADFRSYYGLPIINKPTWKAPDIPGYLFLGGVVGASSVVSAMARLTGRRDLHRVSAVGSTVALGLSGVALVHDLGRRTRFINMLRVFKPTSPMSVGSWLLAGITPFSAAASLDALTGSFPFLGAVGTAGAAAIGPAIATYTAALICDTAVPAWHEGYPHMPFVFAASAASAAAGLGLAGAFPSETGPVRKIGVAGAVTELALMEAMKKRMGVPGEAYHESEKASRYEKAAKAVTAVGVALTATAARRSRLAGAVAGVALMAGSALTRFAIFEAGLTSAEDPRYTVVPQRERMRARRSRGPGDTADVR